MTKVATFGPVDARSLGQLERCMEAGDAEYGVLCADHHPGYSQPIGGGIAYEGYISPSGVGYDIGCGNKAARTPLTEVDLHALGGVESIMSEITRRISFGMGVPAQERTDHPVLDRIRDAPANLTLIALVLTILVVIATKAYTGRGTPLRGGLPSGHAALAFAGWMAATYVVGAEHRFLISSIALVMAFLVAQTRIEAGVHSAVEVAYGGILGALVTLAVFQLFS
jgi:hypothetical protein